MSYTSIPSQYRVTDLTIDNIKQNIADICCEDYSPELLRYFCTWWMAILDTNFFEDLFSSFFIFNLSMDFCWESTSYIKVWTRWKVNGNTDWVSKRLSMNIDIDFTNNYEVYENSKRTTRPEEEILENIQEILQLRAQECLLFQTEFIN